MKPVVHFKMHDSGPEDERFLGLMVQKIQRQNSVLPVGAADPATEILGLCDLVESKEIFMHALNEKCVLQDWRISTELTVLAII